MPRRSCSTGIFFSISGNFNEEWRPEAPFPDFLAGCFAKLEDFVPDDHPLRGIRQLVNTARRRLDALFDTIYAEGGGRSIAPEKLMRAVLLQVFYSIRSERQLMEQMRYKRLYRWFVGLAIDDEACKHSVFSKNRDRLLAHEVVESS